MQRMAPPTDPETCGKETELGTGFVDFERVIRQLLDVDMNGYLIIERELNGGNGDVEIIKALNYLKTIVVRQKGRRKKIHWRLRVKREISGNIVMPGRILYGGKVLCEMGLFPG